MQFLSEVLKERDNLDDLSIDKMILLKCDFKNMLTQCEPDPSGSDTVELRGLVNRVMNHRV
jgi:hypothetical protein